MPRVRPADARRGRPCRRREDAFTLVKLMIFVTVLNVLVAAALPLWSQQVRREKEEELIFRGLQYAEAIRIFQKRVGRYPLRLEELLEIEPRSIRQLWPDPMTENGKWGVILGERATVQQPNSLDGDQDDQGRARPRRRSRRQAEDDDIVTTGPITGVHSRSEDDSIKIFAGAQKYNEWLFTPQLIPVAPTTAGDVIPSLSAKWVGRPLPEGAEPVGGEGIEDEFGEDEEGDEERGDSRRERRERRRRGGGSG